MNNTVDNKIKDLQGRLNKLILESNHIVSKLKSNWDTSNFIYDPDSSPKAWEYYLTTYKNIFEKTDELNAYNTPTINDNDISFWCYNYPNALYQRIIGTFLYSKPNETLKLTTPKLLNGKNIGLAGDCCFNFNNNKIKKFNRFTENNKDIENLLESIKKALHHSPLNFALMPINGSMNNIKGDGIQGLDRFDTFISALDLYFENKGNPIAIKLIAEFETSQNSLVPFLEWIDSFENYLKLFYPELLIDDRKEYNDKKTLLEKLIESGVQPINATDRVIEYIELAIRFWEAKLDYYNKQNQLQKS